jgi:putative phosphoribosyl transferase
LPDCVWEGWVVKLPIEDRATAGRELARALHHYADRRDVVVLALPRGGVPVAAEIARTLDAELDVLIVRKLGAPLQPELAVGAIASGGVRVLNDEIVAELGVTDAELDALTRDELRELERRERLYRGDRARTTIAGRCVIVVDDGIATGATMRAGIAALRKLKPARIVVAVAVAPEDTVRVLEREADDVVCLATPAPFWAVGRWYVVFDQVSDDEVKQMLNAAWKRRGAAAAPE